MATTKEQREQLRAEWVKALRSGEFRQTKCDLENDRGNCCLGVLCRVIDRLHPRQLTIQSYGHVTMFDEHMTVLPDSVKKFSGVRSSFGGFASGSLAGLNDGGSTFAEIADVIESRPEGLFVD